MKVLIIALLGLSPLIAHAQTPAYHWEVNGVPVPGATSVTFVATPQADTTVNRTPFTRTQLVYTSKMLRGYKVSHLTGSLFEVAGAAVVTINLLEMNRTQLPKSNYTPFFVIGGGLALTGYVI